MTPLPDEVFDIDALSQYLKLPKSTLYKLAQEGRLPGQKVGRHWRFLKRAVDEWLERRPVAAVNAKEGRSS